MTGIRKVAIITGASRGLGRQVALAFGRAGFNTVVNYASFKNGADDTVGEIIASGVDAFAYQADVSEFAQVDAMVNEALERFGRIDLLVNNAATVKDGLIARLKTEDWQEVIDVNLKGAFNTIKAVSRPMMKARAGHIVNVSSILGIKGGAGQGAYSASKAGLIGLTKAAARELSARNVQVNCVLPGYMLTEMGEGASEAAKKAALEDNLLKRYSEPEEAAGFILHLATMKAVSGQVFNLDSRMV